MIWLIITCSIDNKQGIKWGDRRRQEYYLGIANCLHLLPKEIKPIIVENTKDGASYLDVFNCPILYTKNNEYLIDGEYTLHKGYRELIDIKKVMEKFEISDDDMIIKMTGRYLLFNDNFFQKVINNPDKDAIFRQYNVMIYTKEEHDMVLGLYALRGKYMRRIEYNDYKKGAEQNYREEINQYIPQDKILKVDKLFMRCIIGETFKLVDC